MSIRHVILWKLKADIPAAEKAEIVLQIKKGLEGLVGKVPGLLSAVVTTDNRLASSTADLMLDSIFSDEESLLAYRMNPDHVAVANTAVRPFVSERLCLDFVIP